MPQHSLPSPAWADAHHRQRDATTALVLQGGGALGSYQAGVYDATARQGKQIDWVAGVSIGAINAALIAGNAPADRVDRLNQFWQLVSSAPGQQVSAWWADRAWNNQFSALSAMAVGIPGFFEPRQDPRLLMGGAAPVLSFYDTSPLRETLERFVDFDRINRRETRLSVGAVNVRTGNSIYFDNSMQRIGVEHILASCALPPGFPPVSVDGEDYWDGGLVSNTPLQYVLDSHVRSRRLLVLQVDLFSARGPMPTTLSEVMERQKDIMYSSRTRMNTDTGAANVNLQQAFVELLAGLPARLRDAPGVAEAMRQLTVQPVEVVHLIYRDKPYEQDSKDYEFSRAMVREHWAAGTRDAHAILSHPDWLKASTSSGVTTFDLVEPAVVKVKRPAPAAASSALLKRRT